LDADLCQCACLGGLVIRQQLTHSPFQQISFRGRDFIIKRDDLLGPELSGNKARKLYHFFQQGNLKIKTIASFGGNQSNFMLALSELAKIKGWRFEYHTRSLPKYLKANIQGNLKQAMGNGMVLQEINQAELSLIYLKKYYENKEDIYLFDQGGRQSESEAGMAQLAIEIKEYVTENKLDEYHVFLPSGTGASAFYLQQHLPDKVVNTCACVGNEAYLFEQMASLAQGVRGVKFPEVLTQEKKPHFGKLNVEHLEMYQCLLDETNIEFDLMYDPIGWKALLENALKLNGEIIYVHCGGVSGNETMLRRYDYASKRII
jgi:1-aminocyclopropane-1-carboxylate deaminase